MNQKDIQTERDVAKHSSKNVTSIFRNGSETTTSEAFTRKMIEYANRRETRVQEDK